MLGGKSHICIYFNFILLGFGYYSYVHSSLGSQFSVWGGGLGLLHGRGSPNLNALYGRVYKVGRLQGVRFEWSCVRKIKVK